MSAVVTVIQIAIASAALGAAIPAALADRRRLLAGVTLVAAAVLCCAAFALPLIDRATDVTVGSLSID